MIRSNDGNVTPFLGETTLHFAYKEKDLFSNQYSKIRREHIICSFFKSAVLLSISEKNANGGIPLYVDDILIFKGSQIIVKQWNLNHYNTFIFIKENFSEETKIDHIFDNFRKSLSDSFYNEYYFIAEEYERFEKEEILNLWDSSLKTVVEMIQNSIIHNSIVENTINKKTVPVMVIVNSKKYLETKNYDDMISFIVKNEKISFIDYLHLLKNYILQNLESDEDYDSEY